MLDETERTSPTTSAEPERRRRRQRRRRCVAASLAASETCGKGKVVGAEQAAKEAPRGRPTDHTSVNVAPASLGARRSLFRSGPGTMEAESPHAGRVVHRATESWSRAKSTVSIFGVPAIARTCRVGFVVEL